MNEGMIKDLVTRIKGGNTNSVAITKPSTYKPPVPSPHVAAAQAQVDAQYKADVKAGTPAARTARMKARIAAMKEEALQIDEVGDTPSGLAKLKSVQARAHNTMNTWSKNPKSGYSSTPPEVKKATKTSVRASNRIHKDPTTGKPFAYAALRREDVEQIDEVTHVKESASNPSHPQAVTKVMKAKGNEGHPGGQGLADAILTHHNNGLRVKSTIGWDSDHSIHIYDGRNLVGSIFSAGHPYELGKYEHNPKYKGSVTSKEARGAIGQHRAHKQVRSWARGKVRDYTNEEVEQIDETGPQKRATRLHNKLRDAVRGARYKQTGMPVFEPEAQHKTPQAYNKAIGRALRGMGEEVEQVDETNARHSFTAAQQVLTPRKKDVLNASSNMPRAKAAAKKYARRVAKISGTYKPKEVIAHLKSMGEETQYIEERLKSTDPTSKWVSDFVHSDNPRFKGKSKKERISMALGAYYASKKKSK